MGGMKRTPLFLHFRTRHELWSAEGRTAAHRPTDKPSPCWVKIKNPRYSPAEGPEELFERARL